MDFDDLDNEPAEPSDLGFDPYSGTYIDDDPIDEYDYFDMGDDYPEW